MKFDPAVYRCTAGLCLGFRQGMASALVVVAVKRTDKKRVAFVVHEFERDTFDADTMEEAISVARQLYRPVVLHAYYGGKDDEKVFRVMSIRLGWHIEPMPGDQTAPMQLLINDFRTGQMRARPDSMVVRDVKAAIWRDGVPDQTGILVALRAAHWGQQQYRPRTKKQTPIGQKLDQKRRELQRKLENPY